MIFLASVVALVLSILAWGASRGKSYSSSMPFIVFASLMVGLSQCFSIVPAGCVGVVDFFGRVSDLTLKSGINTKNPLSRVVKMSTKTQELKETMQVPSEEGLSITIDASLLFHLDPDKAASIYKTVGDDYASLILEPQLKSITRGRAAGYEAVPLYTTGATQIADPILSELAAAVGPRGIFVEKMLIRKVSLPDTLTTDIEQKIKAEKDLVFAIKRDSLEAERKRIEAKGIDDYQKTVSASLNENILRLRGIEATEKLANSNNTKVIVVGGKDGLPLIMNDK